MEDIIKWLQDTYGRLTGLNSLPTNNPAVQTPTPTATPKPMSMEDQFRSQFSDYTRGSIPEDSYTNIYGNQTNIKDNILYASMQNGISPALLSSILYQESGIDRNRKPTYNSSNDSWDRGVASLNNKAYPDITDIEASDPTFSIHRAAKILKDNYTHFGNWKDAIGAYNAGIGGQSSGVDTSKYINGVKANISSNLAKQLGL